MSAPVVPTGRQTSDFLFYMGFNLLSVKPQKQCFYFALLIFNEYSSIIPFSCISKNAVALWLRITNPDTHCRRIANPTGRENDLFNSIYMPSPKTISENLIMKILFIKFPIIVSSIPPSINYFILRKYMINNIT